jgi:hypothetical protein
LQCKRCGRDISKDEGYEYLGETLCEGCYIDVKYPVKACDPWAVYSATRSRETLGLKGTEGLTELQQAVYEFVRSNGKATREELMKNFNVAGPELQTQLAILRHCQLVKGTKKDGRIYLVPFG